jgi:YHS domain-containing protein
MEMPSTVKDPVCGLDIVPNLKRGWDFLFEEVWYHFCGSECRYKFSADPAGFLKAKSAAPIVHSPAAATHRRTTYRSVRNRLISWFRERA